jgi:hypothetical protein
MRPGAVVPLRVHLFSPDDDALRYGSADEKNVNADEKSRAPTRNIALLRDRK